MTGTSKERTGAPRTTRVENDVGSGKEVLTLRLPGDVLEALRTYAFFTRRSMNEVVNGLVMDFLAGPGRLELTEAISERARSDYRIALDKLADS